MTEFEKTFGIWSDYFYHLTDWHFLGKISFNRPGVNGRRQISKILDPYFNTDDKKRILKFLRLYERSVHTAFKDNNTAWLKLTELHPEFLKIFNIGQFLINTHLNDKKSKPNKKVKRGPKALTKDLSIALLWIMNKAETSLTARKLVRSFIKTNGEYEGWFHENYNGHPYPFTGFGLNTDYSWFSILRRNLERNVLNLRVGSKSKTKTNSDLKKLKSELEKFQFDLNERQNEIAREKINSKIREDLFSSIRKN